MDQEAMSVLTILIFQNMIFIISMNIQTFAFVHRIFNIHQYLGNFCTMLHNSSRSPIWYSMFQHEYKHKCELPHLKGSPHFL
jgi:hypothetical protein